MSKYFLERVKERLINMTPEECLELHKEAQRTMSDPVYITEEGPVKGELAKPNEEHSQNLNDNKRIIK